MSVSVRGIKKKLDRCQIKLAILVVLADYHLV